MPSNAFFAAHHDRWRLGGVSCVQIANLCMLYAIFHLNYTMKTLHYSISFYIPASEAMCPLAFLAASYVIYLPIASYLASCYTRDRSCTCFECFLHTFTCLRQFFVSLTNVTYNTELLFNAYSYN